MSDQFTYNGRTYLPISVAAQETGVDELFIRAKAKEGSVLLRAVNQKIYIDIDGLRAVVAAIRPSTRVEAAHAEPVAPSFARNTLRADALPASFAAAPSAPVETTPIMQPGVPILAALRASAQTRVNAETTQFSPAVERTPIPLREPPIVRPVAATPAVSGAVTIKPVPILQSLKAEMKNNAAQAAQPQRTETARIESVPVAPAPKLEVARAEIMQEPVEVKLPVQKPRSEPRAKAAANVASVPAVPVMTAKPAAPKVQKVQAAPRPVAPAPVPMQKVAPAAPLMPVTAAPAAPVVRKVETQPAPQPVLQPVLQAVQDVAPQMAPKASPKPETKPLLKPQPLQEAKPVPKAIEARVPAVLPAIASPARWSLPSLSMPSLPMPSRASLTTVAVAAMLFFTISVGTVSYSSPKALVSAVGGSQKLAQNAVLDNQPSTIVARAVAKTIPVASSTVQPIYYVYNYPVIERIKEGVRTIQGSESKNIDVSAQLDALYSSIQKQILSLSSQNSTQMA